MVVAFGLIIQDYLGYRMSLLEKLPTLRAFNAITGFAEHGGVKARETGDRRNTAEQE